MLFHWQLIHMTLRLLAASAFHMKSCLLVKAVTGLVFCSLRLGVEQVVHCI